jgi:hypothetical protein
MFSNDNEEKGKKFRLLAFNEYPKETRYMAAISLLSAIILVFLFIFIWNSISAKLENQEAIFTCNDGTFYDTCDLNKPYYCDSKTGLLIENASICGCPDGMSKSENSCVSQYATEPKEISLKYILRGRENSLNFTAYNGLANYLSSLPKSINYAGAEKPLRADFKLRNINNEEQRKLILPILIAIQNTGENKEEQARIAISIVQNIKFGESDEILNFAGRIELNYSRYPYEVLYDEEGVCGEKSELLAFLLKEIGYGVAFFYYPEENHEALGIKCPVKYSVDKTGYCFIETTGPSIITDSKIEYFGGIKLKSKPEIILVSNGEALGSNMYEYKDAKKMIKFRDNWFVLFREARLSKLKEKYGLVEEYYSG